MTTWLRWRDGRRRLNDAALTAGLLAAAPWVEPAFKALGNSMPFGVREAAWGVARLGPLVLGLGAVASWLQNRASGSALVHAGYRDALATTPARRADPAGAPPGDLLDLLTLAVPVALTVAFAPERGARMAWVPIALLMVGVALAACVRAKRRALAAGVMLAAAFGLVAFFALKGALGIPGLATLLALLAVRRAHAGPNTRLLEPVPPEKPAPFGWMPRLAPTRPDEHVGVTLLWVGVAAAVLLLTQLTWWWFDPTDSANRNVPRFACGAAGAGAASLRIGLDRARRGAGPGLFARANAGRWTRTSDELLFVPLAGLAAGGAASAVVHYGRLPWFAPVFVFAIGVGTLLLPPRARLRAVACGLPVRLTPTATEKQADEGKGQTVAQALGAT